ncbi:MAG TPA: DNA-directed RNA polymerase subunit omega [Candidatus Ornithoclostridium faecavium]|nr:DNA-directed RNA polymerase subunit omega [Candidatus Ornithoclostridium faecavium]
MMIDPPIDKLIKKAECRYALVCGVAKRARQLDTQYPDLLEEAGMKSLSYAAKEVYEGKIVIKRDNQ